jgi:hypothetical protein
MAGAAMTRGGGVFLEERFEMWRWRGAGEGETERGRERSEVYGHIHH